MGTCRVWSGPRSGGAYTALSLNFESFGTGTCAGTEVNTVRALAAGGPTGANGSEVIYATTDGSGPNELSTPVGGNVWVTTNATAVSGTVSNFANTTLNGPGGSSINPNQFPISSVAIDSSDPTGNTAYVTVMGFTAVRDKSARDTSGRPRMPARIGSISPAPERTLFRILRQTRWSLTRAHTWFMWARTSAFSRVQHPLPHGLNSDRVQAASGLDSCPTWRSLRSRFSTPAGRSCCALPPTAAACGSSICSLRRISRSRFQTLRSPSSSEPRPHSTAP